MTSRARRFVAAVLGCVLACAGADLVMAQTTAPEADPLNHAFAVDLGSGIYVSENRSVFIFRIAPRIKIRSENDHKFGVRLRFNATFGFYDLVPKDLIGEFVCLLDGTEVFKAEFDSGTAGNPYLSFFVRVEKSGLFRFLWTGEQGERYQKETRIEVN